MRRRAAAQAGPLLAGLGLLEGRQQQDGTVRGGSPGFDAALAELPARARRAVAVLNLLPEVSQALPSGLPGGGAAAAKLVLGGVLTAVSTAGTAVAIGAVTGDPARMTAAGIGLGAALTGHVAALQADRRHARFTELVKAADDARRVLPADLQAAHDVAVADALADLAARRSDLAALESRLGGLAGVHLSSGPARDGGLLSRVLDALTPGDGPGRAARATTSTDRHDALQVPGDIGSGPLPDPVPGRRTPGRRAWAAKAVTGPAVTAGVAGLGLAVAGLAGVVTVTLATVTPLAAAVLGAVGTSLGDHALARRRSTLEDVRAAVADARARATTLAQEAVRAQAAAAVDTRLAADLRTAEATADRLAALQADARHGAVPGVPAEVRAGLPGARDADAAPTTTPEGDQLVPGARVGPVDPSSLTDADRRVVAALGQALAEHAAARGRARRAARARVDALLRGSGLAAPPGTGSDPDALGWPHRRAVLPDTVQLGLAALDELPSAVPAAAWYQGRALAGSLLPGVGAGVLAAVTLGVGPLAVATLALAPVALAAATAASERALAARTEQQSTAQQAPLTSALVEAARAERDAADEARRADDRARLAEVDAANTQTVAALDQRAEEAAAPRRRRRPRRVAGEPVRVPAPGGAPAPAARPVVGEPAPPRTAAPHPPLRVALARVVPGALAVAASAAAVAMATGGVTPADVVDPVAWRALDDQTVAFLATAAGTAVTAVSGVAGAVGEHVSRRSAATADATRKSLAAARRARYVAVELAARDRAVQARTRALDAELVRVRTVADQHRAAAARHADRVLDGRGPGLLGPLLDRAATLLAAVERWLPGGRPTTTPEPVVQLAGAVRQVEQLRTVAVPDRPAATAAVVGALGAQGLLDPGAEGARRRSAVPQLLAVVAAALVGVDVPGFASPAEFDAHVRAIANATGWWPEDECGCPPGCGCTCGRPGSLRERAPAAPETAPAPAPAPDPAPAPAPQERTRAPAPLPPLPYGPPTGGPPTGGPPTGGPPTGGSAPSAHAPAPPRAEPAPTGGRVDVDPWPDGTGVTTAVVVPVRSPGGEVVEVLARWVEPGPGRRPVLVLSEIPGPGFWWGVPAAVLLAATLAVAALGVDGVRRGAAVVLGRAADGTLTELPVGLGPAGPEVLPGRAPRVLPSAEGAAAARSLRLRPVGDLLGRLRQPVSPAR